MYSASIRKKLQYALFPLLVLMPATAMPDTATGTFNVTATVLSACSVSATDLAFGTYTPSAGTDNDNTSTISVTCTLGTSYNVGLNAGLHGGSVTTRQMKGPAVTDLLDYGIYSDVTRLVNWGNTVGTDTVTGVGIGLLPFDHTAYGRITAGQDVSPGAYNDTITVTVTF